MMPAAFAFRAPERNSELQRLRDRVAELEELLGIRDQFASQTFTGPHRARIQIIASLLLRRELVGVAAIRLAIGLDDYDDKSIAVYVHYARHQLRPHGVTLFNDRGRGWFVDAAGKKKLRELLRGAP